MSWYLTSANRAFTHEASTFVLSHMNVKIRVFTHGLGAFVFLHMKSRIVYLHMSIRAFTHDASCFYTGEVENLQAAAMSYEAIESLNTESN